MWMEAKMVIDAIAIIAVAIVCSQIILFNSLLGFLCIVCIGLVVFGDLLIGMKISDFKPVFEPTPMGWELIELQLLDGKTRFMNTKKGAHGKRSFRIHNEDASVINDGTANFTLTNGNRGFRAHENFDRNISPQRCKALSQMPGEDVKEIYYTAREHVKKQSEGE